MKDFSINICDCGRMILLKNDWIELKVITRSEVLEMVSSIFDSFDIAGIEVEDPNDIKKNQSENSWDYTDTSLLEHNGKAASITAYFENGTDIKKITGVIEQKLFEIRKMGFDIGEGKIEIKAVHEKDWADNWKKYYKPTKVGKNIVVKPVWETYSKRDGEIVIEMDPGMAFGTGTHETTRMCISDLEKCVKKNSTVFDIGCGSGILGITASKLGAKDVFCVDLDPEAVKAAHENSSLNKALNIYIKQGNLTDVLKGTADVVVANIIADAIIELSGSIRKFLKKDGVFISSGIIKERKDEVIDSLHKNGFKIVKEDEIGDWVAIISKLI